MLMKYGLLVLIQVLIFFILMCQTVLGPLIFSLFLYSKIIVCQCSGVLFMAIL